MSQLLRVKHCIGSVAFCFFASCVALGASNPLEQWTSLGAVQPADGTKAVAFGNGVYVAVGNDSLQQSVNGRDWVIVP